MSEQNPNHSVKLEKIETRENSSSTDSLDSVEKIKAYGGFISSIAQLIKSVTPIIWVIVIVVVIVPAIGKLMLAKSFQSNVPIKEKTEQVVTITSSDTKTFNQIDDAVKKALQLAYQDTDDYAEQKLDQWVENLAQRIDSSFLEWYFNYFNQKQIEYKGFFTAIKTGTANLLKITNKSTDQAIAEEITENFQIEFAKRVLRPQIAQMELENITNQTVRHYLDQVSKNINQIQVKYKIPQADWNRYLNDIAVSTYDTEGNISNTPLKVFVGGTAYLAVKPLVVKMLPTISSKVLAKLATKTSTKLATKTGGVVAGKVGSVFLDATVGVGIILWDVWDVNHTAEIEKPILRDNLITYLEVVKDSLLHNPDTGIMSVINQIQEAVIQSIITK